jgi:cellulose synthase/poly-beta-1,6-N-acetylglucosamine synthase-like glycosyltransferase
MQADSIQGNDSKNDYTQSSYVVISPCRDEDEYMVKTLDSMVAQTHRPKKWIIVDDGSTDSSPEILRDYAARYPFIEIVTRANRGYRKVGPGVVDAFYEGYNRINADEFAVDQVVGFTAAGTDAGVLRHFFDQCFKISSGNIQV